MRITDMITQDEFAGCFINFSPLLLEVNREQQVRMNREQQVRIQILILGFKGLSERRYSSAKFTFKFGNFTNLKALFPAKLTDFP